MKTRSVWSVQFRFPPHQYFCLLVCWRSQGGELHTRSHRLTSLFQATLKTAASSLHKCDDTFPQKTQFPVTFYATLHGTSLLFPLHQVFKRKCRISHRPWSLMKIWCTYGDKRKIETRNVVHNNVYSITQYEVLGTRSVKKVLSWQRPFNLSLVNFARSLWHYAIWR